MKAGVPVNRLNERGDTALDGALGNGKHEAARILKEKEKTESAEVRMRLGGILESFGDKDK